MAGLKSNSYDIFIVGGGVMGSSVAYHLLTFPILMLALALLPALFVGSITGKWLNRRISHGLFIRLICIFVSLMGVWLIIA